MTNILGISAYYHDAAAALIRDGEIVAACQEERWTRKKHDARFPEDSIAYCLREAGIEREQIDYVAFYEKPLLKFERLLETYLSFAPSGFVSFTKAMPVWLREKLHLPRQIRKGLGGAYRKRIIFPQHHESHAASAFFPSPFEQAAILTLDGVGEWATASVGVGDGNQVRLLQSLKFPHSLGLLYSAFTYYCGFQVNSGEYKLMGLAPYGEPVYAQTILEHLLDLKEDGSFRLDLSYFNYCQGLTMTSAKFHRLFGGPPRPAESKLDQRHMDLAASIQKVTEEIMLRSARHAREQTGMNRLCLAGGVALNCVGNGRILREAGFDDVWIQPASGDAGGALGAALLVWYQLLEKPRGASPTDRQRGSRLGPAFSNDEIETMLQSAGVVYHRLDDEMLFETVSQALADEKVVGWFQGRMEFGPRALGSRSILGDARSPQMQSVMNQKIKFRESFRPFAPIVKRERAAEFFELEPQQESPYMLLVAGVQPGRRNEKRRDASSDLLERLRELRSDVPAVTHIDYSARIQTVDPQRDERLYTLLEAFERRTGCPVLVNTSFNVRGEPIVCRPEEALRCFLATHMDLLVMENCVLRKEEQTRTEVGTEAYLAQFALD